MLLLSYTVNTYGILKTFTYMDMGHNTTVEDMCFGKELPHAPSTNSRRQTPPVVAYTKVEMINILISLKLCP